MRCWNNVFNIVAGERELSYLAGIAWHEPLPLCFTHGAIWCERRQVLIDPTLPVVSRTPQDVRHLIETLKIFAVEIPVDVLIDFFTDGYALKCFDPLTWYHLYQTGSYPRKGQK